MGDAAEATGEKIAPQIKPDNTWAKGKDGNDVRKGGCYMALVAETLVEEWLNRKGYFTICGIRTGHGEIDLLAASFREPNALHVEVTVAVEPIGYIAGSGVKKRTPDL